MKHAGEDGTLKAHVGGMVDVEEGGFNRGVSCREESGYSDFTEFSFDLEGRCWDYSMGWGGWWWVTDRGQEVRSGCSLGSDVRKTGTPGRKRGTWPSQG